MLAMMMGRSRWKRWWRWKGRSMSGLKWFQSLIMNVLKNESDVDLDLGRNVLLSRTIPVVA
jgi:hypothetical protein